MDLHKILKLKAEDVSLEESDILYVPDSAGKHALHRVGDMAVSLASGVALVRATTVPIGSKVRFSWTDNRGR